MGARVLNSNLDNRSGRVIALCRLALAGVFLLVLYIDPNQPVRSGAAGYLLLGSYVALAAILLVISWNDWWMDYRLRLPSIVLDGVIYLSAVYFTESITADFVSPFLSFFVFMMLSATLRWGWRGMAIAAAFLSFGYLAVGWYLHLIGFDVVIYRYGRRGTYMILLSLILVWFGLQRRVPLVSRLDIVGEDRAEVPLDQIGGYAMKALDSSSAVVGWWSAEDPVVVVHQRNAVGSSTQRLPPSAVPEPSSDDMTLFDRKKNRRLIRSSAGTIASSDQPYGDPLAELLDIQSGLAIPISSSAGKGVVILTGIRGASVDHLHVANSLAQEISSAIDRQQLAAISRDAAIARLRTTLARDLHDSVAQTLTGVSFRLEAVRAMLRAGEDPEPELVELKAGLAGEHQQVRRMIDRLRETSPKIVDVAVLDQIRPTLAELERKWKAKVSLDVDPPDLALPIGLAYDVQQILREAVANGARHGGAREFAVSVKQDRAGFSLSIADDGTGFHQTPPPLPRSIEERTRANGGTLRVQSSAVGARLSITLPYRMAS